jgi:hypothetical protein
MMQVSKLRASKELGRFIFACAHISNWVSPNMNVAMVVDTNISAVIRVLCSHRAVCFQFLYLAMCPFPCVWRERTGSIDWSACLVECIHIDEKYPSSGSHLGEGMESPETQKASKLDHQIHD